MANEGTSETPDVTGVEGLDGIDLSVFDAPKPSETKAPTEPTKPPGEPTKGQPATVVPAKPVQQPPTAPVPAPPAQPAAQPPVVQPQGQPQQPPQVAPQPVPGQPPQPAPQPGQQPPSPMESYQQKRGQIAADIAKRYTISPEDATRILTEPEKVFPEMIGRLFVDIYEAVYANVHSQLPGIIAHLNKQQEGVNETRKAFNEAWPALNKAEYEPVIRQVAQIYHQTNPKASREEAIKAIGAIVSYQLGIGIQPVNAPATPAVPRPPIPGGPGPAAGPAHPGGGSNFFADFSREIEEVGNRE